MRSILKRFCLATLLVFFPLFAHTAEAKSPVWKASKDGRHVYLGGTFHLLAPTDHPLPSAFEKAYQEADILVFETDMEALSQPEYLNMIMEIMVYSDGRTLRTQLQDDTWDALVAYLESRNLTPESINRYTPVGISLSLALGEMMRIGMSSEAGVDKFYSLKAKRDNKTMLGLEDPEEHIAFIAAIGKQNQDALVKKTLLDIELMETTLVKMKEAWREGDNVFLNNIMVEELQAQFPDIYKIILTERNNSWLPQIEAMTQTEPVEFVLVGAMHLVGDDGIITKLKERGYTLENL